MAKRKMTKRGGFSKRRMHEVGAKIKNEFVNPKSLLRQQFYQDGPIRTKGLDYLDRAANASVPLAALNPALLPYAAGLQTASKSAKAVDKAARMMGWGKRKRSKGSGKKRARKSKK